MRNTASLGLGVCGQGRARDRHWSLISVQAVECSSLGLGVAAGASYSERPKCVGQLMIGISVVQWTGEAYKLSEDGSIG